MNQRLLQEMKVYYEQKIRDIAAQKMREMRARGMSKQNICSAGPRPRVRAQHHQARTKEDDVRHEGRMFLPHPWPLATYGQ